jgi:hypothetical protein
VKVTYRTLRSSDAWTAPTAPGAELPKVLTVLKWGDNNTSQGLVRVTETTLSAMPGYHKAMNWDEMAIDYEHASSRPLPPIVASLCRWLATAS